MWYDEDEKHDRLYEEGKLPCWRLTKVTYPTSEELAIAQILAKMFLSMGSLRNVDKHQG